MSYRKSKYVNYNENGVDLNDLSLRANHIRSSTEANNSRSSIIDPDEDFNESEVSSLNANAPYRRPIHRPLPLRTTLTALFLLLIGVVFGICGLVFFFKYGFSDDRTIPFLVIAAIGFIPGSFHTVIILFAWLEKPGFTYDMIPNYDD